MGKKKEKIALVGGEVVPYYTDGDFYLFAGDSTSLLDQLEPDSVDMIFADPPYMLSNDGYSVHAGKRVSVNKGDWDASKGLEQDFEFHKNWISACKPILKDNGTMWISGTYHSIYQCGFALEMSDFFIINDIAWFKPNAAPNIGCRCFTASHETLLWAKKEKKAKHTFNYQDMKMGDWGNDIIKKPEKQMRSVWAIGTPKPSEKTFGKHPTQKPLELLKRIILASTNEGDTVLDPFAGSSTTGIACAQLGRKYIGIDLSSEYLDLSVKRYEDFAIQGKLL